MPFFIQVILPLTLPQTFTYSVSEAEFEYLKIGMRVAVPFGKSKFYTGLVLELHHNAPTLYEAKEIHQIVDQKPIVTEVQLQHWQWIASYYMCTLGEVFRCALPSALQLESETIISAKKDFIINENELSDEEYLLVEALKQQSSLKISEVTSVLNKKKVLPIIQQLLAKNVITLQEEMIEEYKPKLVRYIRLFSQFNSNDKLEELLLVLKNAQKQKEILLSYFQLQATTKKPISVKGLTEFSGGTLAVIKALIDKEIFEEYYIQEDRVSFDDVNISQIVLSEPQDKALSAIETVFTSKEVCLLHGITASGKTEVYIKLVEKFLEQKKQCLYLLPEIALTTQLVSRLTKHFGNKVAVFHSKYSNNERVEVWNQVLNSSEKAQIVIGARSALFLPFQDLGFIIVDEEHEQTFKQTDPAPRYHARDAAIVLANFHKAKVLLGSATPSIETYFNTKNDKYGLVELHERFGNAVLPEIELVDLKDSYFRKKMTGHFSQNLIDDIAEALSNGEQVILFQNRRGYSPVIECMTCGHVPQCPQCDVSLTYHKFKNQLRCHYCGYSIAKPTNCHACSSIDLTSKGFGTEQIELELASLFPTKNIKRMDQDTTRGKYAFEKLIGSFKNREIDILVGTQMLAKGLDFDNVSLVGILNADSMLYFPDFRAFERSFQMMTQVSGRAGRSDKKGKVIIQTYNTNHNTIQQVVQNDYLSMFNEQLYERKIYHYPPYFKLIKLTLKQKDFDKLKEGSMWLYQVLKQQFDIPVLGPEEPAINRIRNEYIRTILIKIPQEKSLGNTKKTIQKILNSFESVSQFRAIKVGVNVDFY
ncbi:primosomal protein N' [Flavobacterium psychrophilum]|uniref:Replication restart protein PriA n=1 Tax=Flavobacterium psychrophilum (strain ATCC 49511 / DSM 21280 / CIP 103535 / JIP02/86) TaxID=402612 RepID=A6H0P5_FLAPJ|nr:primosomal protein N' [Flavobacterium psychrophilum]MBF1998406.1 primosomal protein N' [Flavobacterium psychrophilum]MBF2082088.1 primosomal protein N' [Flavobacterium psychrophilum]MCB5970731.1 primosomal protein N' [Flavobacterium psychrophilum]MCB5978377.1 primosomal protein N' [Flavobacterium psychrophilum]MCB6002011.1 primosomal protein N' [Flavobacterium psychrophilum]